jgi:hypothetical protein
MIYRKRVHKRRYGVSSGRSFIGLHVGRRSYYLAKDNFPIKIKDIYGNVEVQCG